MPQVPDYEVEHPDEWSAFATVDLHPPKPSGLWGKFGRLIGNDLKKRPPVTTSAGWMLPNMIKLHVRLPIGDMVIYDTNIPIDETTTLVKWVALRTFFTGTWANKDAINRTMRIFYEDAEVVNKVRPELLPFDSAPSCTSGATSSPSSTAVAAGARRQGLAARRGRLHHR